MRFYRIRETLTEEEFNPGLSDEAPYVAVVTFREWMEQQDVFQLGIDMELNHNAVTKAEVNIDSLTGSFSIPDRKAPQKKDVNFSFALDEKGIIFIDDSGSADQLVRETVKKKQWKLPGLERFLYDFLENTPYVY